MKNRNHPETIAEFVQQHFADQPEWIKPILVDTIIAWTEDGHRCGTCQGAGCVAGGEVTLSVKRPGAEVAIEGLCTTCWGSGDATRPWPNWFGVQTSTSAKREVDDMFHLNEDE